MCMADTRTKPSLTPLFVTAAATSSVMRTNSCRFLVLNHRYSVSVFMSFKRQPRRRSEEHTSELQSHSDLVCRLLLEKKKKNVKSLSFYINKKSKINKIV